MKRQNDNLEKLYAEKFKQKQFTFQEKYWEQANALIKQQRAERRRRIAYISFTSIAAVLIASLMIYPLDTNDHTSITENQIVQNRHEQSSVKSSNTVAPNKKLNSIENNTQKTESLERNIPTPKSTITKKQKENNISQPKSPKSITKNSSKTKAVVATSTLADKTGSKTTITNKVVDEIGVSDRSKNINKEQSPVSVNSIGIANQVETPRGTIKETAPLFDATNKKIIEQNKRKSLSTALSLPRKENVRRNNTIEQADINPFNPKESLPINIYLTAGVAIGSELENLSSHKVNSISLQNYGLEGEYLLGKRLGIQSGLQYTKWDEDLSTRFFNTKDNSYYLIEDNSYWKYDTTIGPEKVKVWFEGQWHDVIDTNMVLDSNNIKKIDSTYIEQIDTTDLRRNFQTTIEYYEVPLLLTYHLYKGRFDIQLSTGLSFGIFKTSSGQIINPNNLKHPESANNSSLFNSLQYNLIFGTAVSYSVSEHWKIVARPQVRANINSIYSGSSGIKRKYITYGVNAGIAYSF